MFHHDTIAAVVSVTLSHLGSSCAFGIACQARARSQSYASAFASAPRLLQTPQAHFSQPELLFGREDTDHGWSSLLFENGSVLGRHSD